jgi:uncharacterized protein (DUF2252 family)
MAENKGVLLAERPELVIPLRNEAECRAAGKEARAKVPRELNATFEPAPDRPDPVSLLQEQSKSRVQELVPIRYGRMLVSPFTFFRGAALIMASDLSTTPCSGLTAQLCGDAHLSNFGVFGTPERRLIFDCNDFDETHPGPWEWDVKRLAASVVIAGRTRGHPKAVRAQAIVALGQSYRESMRQMASLSNLEVWYFHVDASELVASLESQAATSGSKKQAQMAATATKAVAKAQTKDSLRALDKLTHVVDGQRRIVSEPPLIVPLEELFPAVEFEQTKGMFRDLLRRYRQSLSTDRRHLLEEYQFSQIARKVVGVGSVGTRAWIVLLHGASQEDVLFLQAKEADASVLERFTKKSQYGNHGARVVAGQRLMQAASDIFLGWQRTDGIDGVSRDYYVRQLQDWKGSIDTDTMIPEGLEAYGKVCALTLARAHARSGDRFAMASYLGNNASFEKALGKFAESYADQNERDYEAFAGACKTGRLHAEEGI